MGSIDVVRDLGGPPAAFPRADTIGDGSVAGAWLEACLLGRMERLTGLTAEDAEWHGSADGTARGRKEVVEGARALLGCSPSSELISLHVGGVVAVALVRQVSDGGQVDLSTLFLRVEGDCVAEVWVAPVTSGPVRWRR